MADPKKINEETKATKELTEAQKEAAKALENYIKQQKEAEEERKKLTEAGYLHLAYEMEAKALAGDLDAAYEKKLQLEKYLRESAEAINTLGQKRLAIEEELKDATGERREELEKELEVINQSITDRQNENELILKKKEAIDKETEAYKNLSYEQRKQAKQMEGFMTALTGGLIKVGAAEETAAFKIGHFIKKMSENENALGTATVALKQFFNPMNFAAAAYSTVIKSTIAMATAFDQAAASFSATTGLAREYTGVLLNVQKQGNRFGITAKEGGEAMASLLANFNDFHRSAPEVQKDLALGVAGLTKFGVSAQESSKLLNTLNKTMGLSGKQALAVTKQIGMMGTKIGISTSKMLKDYQESLKTLAVYGDKSIEVFTGIAAAAKAAGVETGTLLNLAEKFDTFSGAADTTGKLNALLGSQLSATEMLTMSENERIKTLVGTVQATGQAFGSMDKFTQKAIAQAAGISDMAEANKIFGMSLSEYESYEAQMKQAGDAQKRYEDALKSVTPILQKLKILAAEFAAKFGPALETIGSVLETLIEAFTALDDMTDGYLGTIIGGVAGVAIFAKALGGLGKMLNFVSFGLFKKIGLAIKDRIVTMFSTSATAAETAADAANTAGKTANTTATEINTAATAKANKVSKGSIGTMLALGAAILMIGAGVGMAAMGMAKFVEAMSKLKGEQLDALKFAIIGFTIAFVALMAVLYAMVAGPQAVLTGMAVAVLLSIGAAVFLIGAGVAIAALGMAEFVKSLSGLSDIGDAMEAITGAKEVGMSVTARLVPIKTFLREVEDMDIKAELENIALITTGTSANLMTENAVSNLITVASLADSIKNIFNADIVIKIDGDAMDELISKGVYRASMENK